jgi:hypothetical protein
MVYCIPIKDLRLLIRTLVFVSFGFLLVINFEKLSYYDKRITYYFWRSKLLVFPFRQLLRLVFS